MNLSVYIFKKSGAASGTSVEFLPSSPDKFAENAIAETEIGDIGSARMSVLRKGGLAYYMYSQSLDAAMFGFLIVVNNAYLPEVGPLCRFCSDLIAVMSSHGWLLTWSETKGLIFTRKTFAESKEELQEVMSRLEELRDNAVFAGAIGLPPLDYSSTGELRVIDCTQCVGNIPITEGDRCTERLDILLPPAVYAVADVLAEANKTLDYWRKQYSWLSKKFTSLSRQKKRMKWVVVLALCLVAGVVALLTVNTTLKNTKSELLRAENNVESLSSDVDTLMKINDIYCRDIDSLKRAYISAVNNIYSLESETPVKITSMSASYYQQGSKFSGYPFGNQATSLLFEVSYKVYRFSPADISHYPSAPPCQVLKPSEPADSGSTSSQPEEAETPAFASRSTLKELKCELRCYYKRTNNDDYILRDDFKFDRTLSMSNSGSFDTPSFSMGFSVMPKGLYRIELWTESKCMAYKYFSIN